MNKLLTKIFEAKKAAAKKAKEKVESKDKAEDKENADQQDQDGQQVNPYEMPEYATQVGDTQVVFNNGIDDSQKQDPEQQQLQQQQGLQPQQVKEAIDVDASDYKTKVYVDASGRARRQKVHPRKVTFDYKLPKKEASYAELQDESVSAQPETLTEITTPNFYYKTYTDRFGRTRVRRFRRSGFLSISTRRRLARKPQIMKWHPRSHYWGEEALRMDEAAMTDAQMSKREEIVKSLKKNYSDFEKRYGKDRAKSVMYAVATKMAMAENVILQSTKNAELLESITKSSYDYYEATNGTTPSGQSIWTFSTVHPRDYDPLMHYAETVAYTGDYFDALTEALKYYESYGYTGDIHILS